MNGVEIKFGKNVLPSSIARCAGEMACSTGGGMSSPIGLYPRNAPKSAAVGGRCAMAIAALSGTPFVISPVARVEGSADAKPAVTILKKKPMLTRVALFWKVARIPEEAPRVSGGTLLIIELVLGEANKPEPQPSMKISTAKSG